MPTNLSALTRSINRINGTPRSEKKPAPAEPVATEPEPVPQEEAEQVWAEEKEKLATPKGDYADLCDRLTALEDAVKEMTQSLALVNKHVNATQKMLKKVKQDGK